MNPVWQCICAFMVDRCWWRRISVWTSTALSDSSRTSESTSRFFSYFHFCHSLVLIFVTQSHFVIAVFHHFQVTNISCVILNITTRKKSLNCMSHCYMLDMLHFWRNPLWLTGSKDQLTNLILLWIASFFLCFFVCLFVF